MPLSDQSTLTDILSEMYMYRTDLDSLRNWVNELRTSNPANEQILAEMRTLAHNVTIQATAIESRITTREEKHAQLVAVIEDELLLPVTPRDFELAKGYLDAASGIKLKATIEAQARFTSLVTGMQVAEKLGQADNTSTVEITDYDDVPRPMSWIELQILMLRYMVYCKYVESQF